MIVYVDESCSPDNRKTATIEDSLGQWISTSIAARFSDKEYSIVFCWQEEDDLLFDVWMFAQVEEWGSGPLASVVVLRNGRIDNTCGVASGNSLIALGIEELHRRSFDTLSEYMQSPRPSLPHCLSKDP